MPLHFARRPLGPPPTASAGTFPLSISQSGRYLVKANGQPFYLVGDTAWSLPLGLTSTEANTYLSTRAGQGFNTIFLDATGMISIISGTSLTKAGDAPFNGTLGGGQYDVSTVPSAGDVSTTTAGRYWTYLDSLLNLASGYGLFCIVDVYDTYCNWFSTGGTRDGDSPSSTAKLQTFGRFLGQRYASFKNIAWCFGNDYDVTSAGDADMATVIDGIRDYDTGHYFSLEQNQPNGYPAEAFGSTNLRSRMSLNGIYEYNTGPYRTVYLNAYNRGDFGPVLNIETGYELNTNVSATPATVRKGHYVFLLCGACGDVYGNERVGGVIAAGGPWAADWVAQLTSQGGNEMSYFAAFLATIAWHTLVPDQTSSVFSSMGTPTDYSGAAAANGSLAVAYKPPTGDTGTQDFIVAMATFRGTVTAKWFDPTNGNFTSIGTFSNSGSHTFTSPGANSANDNDWALVLTA